MKNFSIAKSRRLRSTPYTSRIEKQGVTAYTIYNHMLLPAAFGSIEDSYKHLKETCSDMGCRCRKTSRNIRKRLGRVSTIDDMPGSIKI